MVTVDNFDVAVTKIQRVIIDKAIIPAGHGIAANTVAGKHGNLHAVIGNKQMITAAHDFVIHIEEKVIRIKLERCLQIQIICKIAVFQIDRGVAVDSVIAEIQ